MQLLETFYVHADRNFRTMMESPIEEGTTMTICGDTHGQWEDFCTIMDMNGLPSESNRVRSRRPFVRGAALQRASRSDADAESLAPLFGQLLRRLHRDLHRRQVLRPERDAVAVE